jgi:hypothetical protein
LTPEQRVLFQQCYSLSYSLQIFSNYAQFRLLDNHGNPFSDKTQLGKLVKELCAPPQEEAAPKKSSPKPQQRKTKKRPSLTKPSPQPKKQFKAK